MNGFKPFEHPKLSLAMNVTPQFPCTQWETPRFQTPQFYNFDGQSHNQLQRNHGQSFTEKQQQVQFDSNGIGEFAEYQSLNGSGDLPDRSSGVNLRRHEAEYSNHTGNHLQSQDPSGHRGSETTTKIRRSTASSTQGLGQNPNMGFDVGYVEHVQNNSMIEGNTSQQNEFSGQLPNPKALRDFYFTNQHLAEILDPQSMFKVFYAQNQNQCVNINFQNRNQCVNINFQNQNQFFNSHDQNQNQNHVENIQPQSQFENIHAQNQNQFVNNHSQNQNQFGNDHDQNQNLSENINPQSQFENIHAQDQHQNEFVNIHAQNQNQNHFVNSQDQNQNQFVNIHGQNQGGTLENQGGNSG